MSSSPENDKPDASLYRTPPSSYTIHSKPQSKTELDVVSERFTYTHYPAILLSALNFAALSNASRGVKGYPSVFQCSAYTAVFAFSGYALSKGDAVNGSGLTAGWSAIWLFFNARNALKSARPFPIAMTAAVATIGSIYGYSYANVGKE